MVMQMQCNRMRDLREDAELSQAELAAALDIAQTTYSGYERGFREPSLEMLCRIADFFHTSTDYLLGRTDDPALPADKPPRR